MEAQIQTLLESLLELGICASEVHPSAIEANTNRNATNGEGSNHAAPATSSGGVDEPGGLVGKKVQDTVEAMSALFSAGLQDHESKEYLIPNEVVDFVDQGRNPELYTRDLMERVAGENMYTNGILDSIGSYQKLLASEMKLAFPELIGAIDDLNILSLTNGNDTEVKMEE